MWSESEKLAYVAGFIDGEGSITISVDSKGCVTPRITITNIDIGALDFCREVIGGRICSCTPRGNRRQQYQLHIYRLGDLQRALRMLLPYLIVKHEQGELLLKFVESRLSHKYESYTPSEWELVEKIRELNRKGA
ncbi:LAGLIDADG family homing endonuclease [bacterium]|nr:LAGLIDADG family homing endonuclease [bacterium]